jgi:integrase
MSKSKPKRRSPGEGSVWEYRTKAGAIRYAIGYQVIGPDGTQRSVTRRRGPAGERWTTRRDAQAALRDALAAVATGTWADPSRQPTGEYLDEWLAGRRLAPSTMASYRKNVRLHVKPYIGSVPLAQLTTARIDKLYRELETSGRADHRKGEGLSPRTVRYVHTILSAALADAADSQRLARNPAARAQPPTAKQAKPPEIHPWTAAQLAEFLSWAARTEHQHAAAWAVLARTGMRRGEALALRWRDIDLDSGAIAVRRSAGLVRVKGEGAKIIEGDTKTCKARVVDIGPATVAVLRAHRTERGEMAMQLRRADALVFADCEGAHLHPERFSRTFKIALARCRREAEEAGREPPPVIRLHDLRHTHATLLLSSGTPVKVVSERLGHSSAVVTMTVYAHVLPGSQRAAADSFDAMVSGAQA